MPSLGESFHQGIILQIVWFYRGFDFGKIHCTFSIWTRFPHRNSIFQWQFLCKSIFVRISASLKTFGWSRSKENCPWMGRFFSELRLNRCWVRMVTCSFRSSIFFISYSFCFWITADCSERRLKLSFCWRSSMIMVSFGKVFSFSSISNWFFVP